MNYKHSILETIGATPLIRLDHGEAAELFVKVEFFNPGGSIKDRAALNMLRAARADGRLKRDTVVIEPTSGNTGVGLAMTCAVEGIRLVIVMPDSMSVERRRLIAAYGAEIVLTPGALGMDGAVKKAEELARQYPSAFIPMQFSNRANADAHFASTGPEIYDALDGRLDMLVCTVGTGGTLTGTGEYLKSQNPAVKIVAVEPDTSAVLSGEKPGPHKIQGIGAGFVPKTLNTKIYDEIIRIKNDDAFAAAKEFAKTEGILVGISSGAAIQAAVELAKRPENAGKVIVALLPDSGDRYYSTSLFSE